MTEAEKAWLACAIDGEGFIGLRNTIDSKTGWKLRSVEIGVVNTDRRFIDEAARLIGDGYIRTLAPRDKIGNTSYAGKLPVFNVRLKHRDKVVAILQEIRPYLIIKASKADAVIEFVRTTDWRREVTPAQRAERSARMRALWAERKRKGA